MSTNVYRRNRRNLLLGGAVAAAASFVGYATVALAHDTSSAGDRSTGVYALTDDEVEAIRDWAAPFASSDDAASVRAGRPRPVLRPHGRPLRRSGIVR